MPDNAARIRVHLTQVPVGAAFTRELDERLGELTHPEVVVREPGVPHHQMPALLASQDVGMVAYQRDLGVDSLPNRLFEYMACGLAVLAPSYSPEIVSILDAEKVGITADFEDSADVARAFTWLAEHPDDVSEMGERARRAFLERYNWDSEADEARGGDDGGGVPMRVLSIVGARPQFVKLAPVARAFAEAQIEHVIVHTGQHYDQRMSEAFFSDLEIPAADVDLGVGSGSHGVQTGAMLAALDDVLVTHDPDWVLVYGDTNSTLAGAVSAVKLDVPVAHLEAGLRSYNRRMPEEINRVLTDHAADLCLAPTDLAMRNLATEGLAERSTLVGDVMTDVCLMTRDLVRGSDRSVDGVAAGEEFVLATLHRAENTDDPARLDLLLSRMAALPLPVVLAVHPRLRDKAAAAGLRLDAGSLVPVDPLAYPDMVAALVAARALVTDSGGLQKEAYLLGTPTVTLRTETEWPETLEGGMNVICPDGDDLAALVLREASPDPSASPYGDGRAAQRVAEVLLSRR